VKTVLTIMAIGCLMPYRDVAAAPAPLGKIVPVSELAWMEEIPGEPQRIARLWGDRAVGQAGVLIKVPGGFDAGVHAHTSDYHAVLISGTWTHSVETTGAGQGKTLTRGSYWMQPAKEMHRDRCVSSTECVVLVYSTGRNVLIPAAVGKPASVSTAQTSVILAAEQLEYFPQAPNLPQTLTVLWGSREKDGGYGQLIRLPGGFDSGLHAHSGLYHGVLVSGTWIHVEENGAGSETELPPGSYVLQPGQGMHIDRCKAGSECLLFTFQEQKADILWPERASRQAAAPLRFESPQDASVKN
jgi:hypothetical protein